MRKSVSILLLLAAVGACALGGWLVRDWHTPYQGYDGEVLVEVPRGMGAGTILAAPAVVFSAVFGWPLAWTVALIGIPTVLYTMVGGVQAVAWADVKQMVLIVFARSGFIGQPTALLLLAIFVAFIVTAMMKAPIRVPSTRPWPPLRLVPPTTTAPNRERVSPRSGRSPATGP